MMGTVLQIKKNTELRLETSVKMYLINDFKLNEVVVADDYFVNALEKEIDYLKAYDEDRLVAGFLETASMKPKKPKYNGWENTEIRGHSLGHYMTAAAQAVAQTGDKELKEKLEYIVSELSKSQLKSGYLSAFPETLFDNVENKKPCWVPWYTMDKIISGLTAAYTLAGIKQALLVVTRLGDWVYNRVSKWDSNTQNTVLAVEYGGMNEAMYDLYKVTKDEKHAMAAHMFDELPLFEELEKGNDILNGKHANTTIPKFLGALYRYVARGCLKEDEFYFNAARKFFDIVVENHTYITGGNSEWEHFGESRILDAERTNCNCETCNTYNMLKLARELFRLTADKKYADFYENTFLNAIMSSQNPKTGMTMYFQPMATGFFKVYSTPFDSFWCCTGTGMENFTKCNDSIYFHNEDTVFVNQFITSRLDWQEKGFVLEQNSDIPNSEKTTFTITSSRGDVKLAVRIPDWSAGKIKVLVNEDDVKPEVKNGYIMLKVNDRDKIQLSIPMKVAAYPLYDNEHCIGLKYGPVVLSAELGTEDMEESKTGVDVTIATRNISIKDFITVDDGDVDKWIENINDNVVRINDGVRFHLKGTDSDGLVFSQHYRQHKERYGIYWNMVEKDSKALQKHIAHEKNKKRRERVAIDSIPVGNDQYELLHNIKGENTGAGTFNGLNLRHAWSDEGWFSYDMKVDDTKKNYLLVKYFGPNEGRTFNIYVDDKLLIEETIMDKNHGDFYDEYYELPEKIIKGKEIINVKFAVRGDSWVGGIFDKLCIVHDYDNNACAANIKFEGAAVDKAFDRECVHYFMTLDRDEISLKVDAENENALVYVNGILIDDTAERVMRREEISDNIKIKIVAEDYKTCKEYIFTVK